MDRSITEHVGLSHFYIFLPTQEGPQQERTTPTSKPTNLV